MVHSSQSNRFASLNEFSGIRSIRVNVVLLFSPEPAYLKPSINVNGFSAHTHTLVGKEGGQQSPWMNKLERYTSVLHPGGHRSHLIILFFSVFDKFCLLTGRCASKPSMVLARYHQFGRSRGQEADHRLSIQIWSGLYDETSIHQQPVRLCICFYFK